MRERPAAGTHPSSHFAMEFAPSIQAVIDDGDEALRAEQTQLEPDTRAVLTACSLRSPEDASRSDFDLTGRR